MTTYLVTGAAGFIGANYVHYLVDLEPDARIVAVDYLGFASNLPNLDPVADRVEFLRADVADFDQMVALYREIMPDYVVNFAAESHNDRAILDPTSFVHSNVSGAQALLECSRQVGVRSHLHVSTIEVYGELPPGQDSFNEASSLNAKTPYSAAKAAGDQLVRAYMQTYPDMNIRMTHCANNYGPYQLPEKLIPLMITNVLRGRKVPVYGDGLQMRDWLHVTDHCAAIHTVLHADLGPIPAEAATNPALLPIFDISARHEISNLEIVHVVLRHLDLDPAEWIEHVADRPNHDRRYLIDPSKLEQELGWRPEREFESGLAETVRWYVDNRAWWEDVLAAKGNLQVDWSTR
ncbi:dTDP-glucose 4,6-dehydratase [Saccharothrix xinjiangensis]|uniref:dTDP-glucose 4,6-dehydratase n=2 Tax=Saccharothrix xinjiangensis TaxID=204798 RepID=A0ABV9Y9T3_9PSEU